MKRHLIVGASLALAASLSGAQAADPGEPVVTVNKEVLTDTEFSQALSERTQGRGGQLPPAQKRQFLQQMVDLQLLAQAAKERGLTDDPTVVAQLENTRRAILARSLIQKVAEEGISDDAVQEAYDEQYADQSGGKEFKARHILVEDEDTAKDLITQLDEGADFAALAKEHSTGPSGKKGGDLGWFGLDQMVPAFGEALKSMDKGAYSGEPVKTRFGWHVIQLDDTRKAEPPKLDEVRGDIESQLTREKIQALVDDLRNEADIDYQADWAEEPSSEDGNGGEEG
ncbi:peptidylprolyl isomerase [Arhodomonas sp. AD133]|uniref:peptidylprolyl isomerase n=1 Tax=Arhodomonas sp. AD133 TaxID=3415009 RepID=UPI003EBD3601